MKSSASAVAPESLEVLPCGEKRDSLGRRFRTAEVRAGLVAEWERSGLTQASFARRAGVSEQTLATWIKVSRAGRPASSPRDTTGAHEGPASSPRDTTWVREGVSFRELAVESVPATTGLTVVLPGGVEVRGCDAATVVALVKALRGAR